MPTETRRDHDHPSYDASTAPEPGAATPRRSQWKLGLLVAGMTTLLLAIVVAVGGELAVRRMERTRTTVPGSMPLLYYRHARLGHALVRKPRSLRSARRPKSIVRSSLA